MADGKQRCPAKIEHSIAFTRFLCCIVSEFMQTTTEETAITIKARELCQAILDQPEYQAARKNIDAFLADDKARAQYDGLMTKGQALQQKQQQSLPLTGEEISSFEKDRDALLANPVARGFLDAQEQMHEFQQTVNQLLSKTLENGRVPTSEELDSGSCEHGSCGCSH
jgi:cell fate (sporulation/competence/biofilm development) regulator YlbF (YheA/YmcA/DUF963 family)